MTLPQGTGIRRWLVTAPAVCFAVCLAVGAAVLMDGGALRAQNLDDELLRDLPAAQPVKTAPGTPSKPLPPARNSGAPAPTTPSASVPSSPSSRAPNPAAPGSAEPGTVSSSAGGTRRPAAGGPASAAGGSTVSGAPTAPIASEGSGASRVLRDPNVVPPVPPPEAAPSDIEGEDVGETPVAVLHRAQERMSDAARRLRAGDASVGTRGLQTEALAALDTVLAREEDRRKRAGSARRTNASGKSGKSGKPGRDGQETSGEPPSSDQGGGNRSGGDSRESMNMPPSEGMGQGGEEGQEGAAGGTKGGSGNHSGKPASEPVDGRAAVMDTEAWGQLPPQLRERLRNALPERFLPGFEPLLEAYYRRLAETPKGRAEGRP